MPSTLNATTSGSGGIVTTGDSSGTLQIQSNGTTVATATSSGFQINTYSGSASLITSQSVVTLSGTSTTLTSSIPSWAKRVTIIFNTALQNSTATMLVRLNGVTTGYTSVAAVTNTGANSVSSTAGFVLYGQLATIGFTGQMTLYNQTGNTWVQSHVGNVDPYPSTGDYGGGVVTLSSALSSILFTTSTGTPTLSGTASVMYE
jgi:hypothetical protein